MNPRPTRANRDFFLFPTFLLANLAHLGPFLTCYFTPRAPARLPDRLRHPASISSRHCHLIYCYHRNPDQNVQALLLLLAGPIRRVRPFFPHSLGLGWYCSRHLVDPRKRYAFVLTVRLLHTIAR